MIQDNKHDQHAHVKRNRPIVPNQVPRRVSSLPDTAKTWLVAIAESVPI